MWKDRRQEIQKSKRGRLDKRVTDGGGVLLAKPRGRCGHGRGSEVGAEMSLEETMPGN